MAADVRNLNSHSSHYHLSEVIWYQYFLCDNFLCNISKINLLFLCVNLFDVLQQFPLGRTESPGLQRKKDKLETKFNKVSEQEEQQNMRDMTILKKRRISTQVGMKYINYGSWAWRWVGVGVGGVGLDILGSA